VLAGVCLLVGSAACGARTGFALTGESAPDAAMTPGAPQMDASPGAGGGSTCGQACVPSCVMRGVQLSECGARSESCCTSLEVTGGTFHRTYTNSGAGPSGEAAPATVSSFRLDKYAVTVARFRRFASAWDAGFRPPEGSGKHSHLNDGRGLANVAQGQLGASAGDYEPGWIAADDVNVTPTTASAVCNRVPTDAPTWTASPATQEALPINCVNWYEAYAFCIWDGGFLPSDAELEYAAAGGSEERRYPWGGQVPGGGSQYAIYDCNYPSSGGVCFSAWNIAPVGTATLGAGRWGQLDLAGETSAWDLDGYSDPVGPCVDCTYVTTGLYSRTTRPNGSFEFAAMYLLPTTRGGGTPTVRTSDFGVRCARVP
jgi:formylglycine-generating enzyme